jgi:hypothetical protein
MLFDFEEFLRKVLTLINVEIKKDFDEKNQIIIKKE